MTLIHLLISEIKLYERSRRLVASRNLDEDYTPSAAGVRAGIFVGSMIYRSTYGVHRFCCRHCRATGDSQSPAARWVGLAVGTSNATGAQRDWHRYRYAGLSPKTCRVSVSIPSIPQ